MEPTIMIVHIYPDTPVFSSEAFRPSAAHTMFNVRFEPLPAHQIFGISTGITKRAIYHQHTMTYAFMHENLSWRVFRHKRDFNPTATDTTGDPLPLFEREEIPHFVTCKACNSGEWCIEGQYHINDRLAKASTR